MLGAGGFGITYLAFDHHLDGPVVLKEYFPAGFAARGDDLRVVASSPENRKTYAWGLARFIEEARTVHRFRHSNVVRVHRFVEAHGTAYIVMEYVEGDSLAAILESRGPLSAAEWRPWLDRLLDGLDHVHGQRYLHRDIKPGNIVVRAADSEPVLIDFGAARVDARERTHTRVLTPEYAPIEQHSSRARQGPPTDIYAVAAVSYRVLTGEAPPSAPERMLNDEYVPLARRLNGTHAQWLAAVDRGLAVRPDERPPSVDAWRALLADTVSLAASAGQGSTSALKRLREAATLGSASAQFSLGWMYRRGWGVEQNLREAVTWLRKAAQQGLAEAQSDLGWTYYRGKGVERDDREAATWFRKAAQQGSADAQYGLGCMYYDSEGIEQDLREAATWLRRAAEQGLAEAQNDLGWTYYQGEGVEQDSREAAAWFRKAAQQGSAGAQYGLGCLYCDGDGVEQDLREAAAWFRKAAEQGDAEAQFILGQMYENGEGVQQDWLEARIWYGKAAEQGLVPAEAALDPDARFRRITFRRIPRQVRKVDEERGPDDVELG